VHPYNARIVSSVGYVHETRSFAEERHPHFDYLGGVIR
jgi:hypothetical protein